MPSVQLPAAKDHRFYMVHVAGSPGPNKRYDSLADAARDATNMCEWKRLPVFVLECVGAVLPKVRGHKLTKKKQAIVRDQANAAVNPAKLEALTTA